MSISILVTLTSVVTFNRAIKAERRCGGDDNGKGFDVGLGFYLSVGGLKKSLQPNLSADLSVNLTTRLFLLQPPGAV